MWLLKAACSILEPYEYAKSILHWNKTESPKWLCDHINLLQWAHWNSIFYANTRAARIRNPQTFTHMHIRERCHQHLLMQYVQRNEMTFCPAIRKCEQRGKKRKEIKDYVKVLFKTDNTLSYINNKNRTHTNTLSNEHWNLDSTFMFDRVKRRFMERGKYTNESENRPQCILNWKLLCCSWIEYVYGCMQMTVVQNGI